MVNVKKFFLRAHGSANKVLAMLLLCLLAAQNAAAQLILPPSAQTELVGYITDSFPVVIGIVVAVVGATLIIRMIKRAV